MGPEGSCLYSLSKGSASVVGRNHVKALQALKVKTSSWLHAAGKVGGTVTEGSATSLADIDNEQPSWPWDSHRQ